MNCALTTAVNTAGRVAVLIHHFNDIPGLELALASLDGEPAEVIIVDNGSATPPHKPALLQNHTHLTHLHIIYLAENIGTAHALNVGMSYASDCDYIARLDCNNQSQAGRITIQREFLDSHPQCHLVGSWTEHIDRDSGKRHVNRYPSDHHDILRAMYHQNVFYHSATMYRRETVLALGGYPTNYKAAEDYALFFELASKYQAANIPKVLTRSHISCNDISAHLCKIRVLSSIKVIARHITPGHILCSLHSMAKLSAQLVSHLDAAKTAAYLHYPQEDIAGYSGRALQPE
jgi:glycosyltransferase involved in cell wall biosynthesis